MQSHSEKIKNITTDLKKKSKTLDLASCNTETNLLGKSKSSPSLFLKKNLLAYYFRIRRECDRRETLKLVLKN